MGKYRGRNLGAISVSLTSAKCDLWTALSYLKVHLEGSLISYDVQAESYLQMVYDTLERCLDEIIDMDEATQKKRVKS